MAIRFPVSPYTTLESEGNRQPDGEIPVLAEVSSIDQVFDLAKKQPEWAIVVSALPALKEIVADLFPGRLQLEIESDPEIADCHYLKFDVTVIGDTAEASALRSEWYRRTASVLGDNCDKIRLVISIAP